MIPNKDPRYINQQEIAERTGMERSMVNRALDGVLQPTRATQRKMAALADELERMERSGLRAIAQWTIKESMGYDAGADLRREGEGVYTLATSLYNLRVDLSKPGKAHLTGVYRATGRLSLDRVIQL